MNVPHSGRVMVRVSQAHFQAIMSVQAVQAPLGTTTRPLFAASRAAGVGISAVTPAAQATEWLLHKPDHADLHPWDLAHQVAQGQLPGTAQFAIGQPVYAEPDLLINPRQRPPQPPAALAVAAALPPAGGVPWPATEGLNTSYGPKPPTVFSPAWHVEAAYANFIGAWARNKGAGIRIAHLDTGYTPGHMSEPLHMCPDQGWNFSEDNSNTADPYMSGLTDQPGHGTATLALLAGRQIDIEYLAGPVFNDYIGGAPEAAIVPVRIGPSVIHIYSATVAEGLDFALAPRGGGMCDVVSLSHGGLPSNAWADAVNRLYDAGVVVVAAAGDSFYFKVIDVATHFTVYPAAFYRVITATGTTFDLGPYITTDFDTMQGCWGPDKVMKKAVAAYTPNVPWMSYKGVHAWDMNGGGTSSSTPQIAAACALWLAEYGSLYPNDVDHPKGWKRVEACRHALFESVRNRGTNLSEIGVGLLNAADMLSDATQVKVQAAYTGNTLPYAPPDKVSMPFIRLLFGLPPPGPGVDEMYDTEAAQIFFRSANVQLARAVEANPDGDPAKALSPGDAKRLRDAFIAEPSMSDTLRAYLEQQAARLS